MSKGIAGKALSHWRRAVAHGISGGMFGWGIAIASFVVAALVGLGILQKFGLPQELPWWVPPLVSVALAFIVVAAMHVFVIAPYRAYHMLNPFQIKIVSGDIETAYPKEQFERQHFAISIRNKSYRERTNCTLHVMRVRGFNNEHHSFPRLIREFSIQSGDEIVVAILSRTLRTAPLESDKQLAFHGQVGLGWGGNYVTLPLGSHDIEIRIGIPDGNAVLIPCRIHSDGDSLRADQVR